MCVKLNPSERKAQMLTGLPLQEEIDHELSSSDRACLSELKAVLERFAKTKRFGVSMLHRHFDMADDEVPLESLGEEDRTSVIRLRKVADVADVSIATAWRLDGPEPTVVARCSATCGPPHRNADGRCDYYSEHSNLVVDG
jgi:hypothetical protein